MKNNFIGRLSLESSAGSGKTYQLARRYITLLSFYMNHFKKNLDKKSDLCLLQKVEGSEIKYPDGISSIAAITFTNKAAAEMKDRILTFLKKIAEIDGKESSLSDIPLKKEDAIRLLIDIIANSSDFNVTTIDSFMNKILGAFAVELGIYPDYNITFNNNKIFQKACDEMFIDDTNHKFLIDYLKWLLNTSRKGINGEEIIRSSLKNYRDFEIAEDIDEKELLQWVRDKYNIDKGSLNEALDELKNSILSLSKNLIDFYKNNISSFKGNTTQWIEKISDIKGIEISIKKLKVPLTDFLKKDSRLHIPEEIISLPSNILNLYRFYKVIKSHIESKSTFIQISKLRELEDVISRNLNIIDGGEIAKIVSKVLSSNNGVTSAFCRLGEHISHYLIDEFQDTSQIQLNSMQELLKNAVSEGGTVFIVGDKKQAIYAWRGGDYTVFDKVKNIVDDLTTIKLNENFRSVEEIVNFNNFIFDTNNLLNNENIKYIREQFDDYSENLIDEIKSIYNDSGQSFRSSGSGYVEVKLYGSNPTDMDDDLDDDLLPQIFEQDMKYILSRGYKLSDILILVRKKDEINNVIRWIDRYFPDCNFITEDSLLIATNNYIKNLLLIASASINPEDSAYREALAEVDLIQYLDDETIKKSQTLPPYEFFLYLLNRYNILSDNNTGYVEKFLEELNNMSLIGKSLREVVAHFNENREISVNIPENLDAIRIMTIHKAKGLEAPVVFIPFYNWKFYDNTSSIYDYVSLKELGLDKKIFCKVDKSLSDILESAKEIYYHKKKVQFIEAVNLMYVANTRAKKILFIYGKIGNNNKDFSTANFLKNIFSVKEENGFYIYTAGKKDLLSLSKKDSSKEIKLSSSIFNDDIRRFIKIIEQKDTETNFYERLMGEFFHLAMSYVGNVSKNSMAIQQAYEKASLQMNLKDKSILDMMEKTVSDLMEFFEVDEFWNEKEFVKKDGKIIRIDRIVRKDGLFYILDYKTGNLNIDSHTKQLRYYLTVFPKKSKGIIYYVRYGTRICL